MSSLLVLLLSAYCLSQVVASMQPYDLDHAELHFHDFMVEHGIQYADEHEKQARFQIFKDNLENVNRMNEEHGEIFFEITKFMDLTPEEFLNSYTGLKADHDYTADCPYANDADIVDRDATESFDWRDHNVVTTVMNQKNCGCCYACSAIGNIESQYAIKHKEHIELSVQQIVDCNKMTNGCGGGFISTVFRELIKEGGCESKVDYPFLEKDGQCQFDQNKLKVKLTGCRSYNLTTQEKVKQLLYKNGPISIAIKASMLQLAKDQDIIPDQICDFGRVNHAVLLVGYGKEGDKPFWIVKNSWGDKWGAEGYFKMQRGEGVTSCAMMNDMMATSVL